ncbi:MAG: hypothetical protein ACK55I_20530, partial [bacterium]
ERRGAPHRIGPRPDGARHAQRQRRCEKPQGHCKRRCTAGDRQQRPRTGRRADPRSQRATERAIHQHA